ncbi:hypothetical protein C8N25_12079 [Algoriphagus antarcticus]|uniref:Uncharacterized protein n=1 Tax=Algoriphagus antarcticus TaxID=238540 RepID=A0A3E0DL22_9BACT|nr:hypothetical protein C8N25_12079 [Algoriphagus antarcticus]
MTHLISKAEKAKMQNPFIQFFKFVWLNIKIIGIVGHGHGGTRK